MKNPIVLAIIGIVLLLFIGIGGLFLVGVAGGVFYKSFKVETPASNNTSPPNLETANLKTVDLSGTEKDTERFFAKLFLQSGMEGVKSYLNTNLSLPNNVKIATPDGVFELKGVTSVILQKTERIAEWGTANPRHKIQVIGIFPNGIGNEKDTFSLAVRYQEKNETK
jgi:hypothetical protein